MIKKPIDIQQFEEAALRLRSVAHPIRIQIINLLSDGKELTVTAIYQLLQMEQAAVSHHLNLLKNNRILNARRDGKNTYYSLKPNIINELMDCVIRCNK